MIQSIVFDIGGVLASDIWETMFLDPNKGLAKHFGLDPNAVHKFGLGLWEQYAYLDACCEEEVDFLEEDYWQRFMDEFDISEQLDFFIQKTYEFIIPVKGMMGLVEQLAPKYELGICSNNSEFFHTKLAEVLGLYKYFDPKKEILSTKIGASKTSPNYEMFKALDKALDTPKENVLFVDDRQKNIERAIEYGFNAVLLPQASDLGEEYLRRFFKMSNIKI